MPRNFKMSPRFTGRHTQWRKLYKGETYSVSYAALGIPEEQWTKEASYKAANEWWEGEDEGFHFAAVPVLRGRSSEDDAVSEL